MKIYTLYTYFKVPNEFIRKVVILLNKGSIHSSMTLSDDCSGSIGLREDFAKHCFETLLEFSLLVSKRYFFQIFNALNRMNFFRTRMLVRLIRQ